MLHLVLVHQHVVHALIHTIPFTGRELGVRHDLGHLRRIQTTLLEGRYTHTGTDDGFGRELPSLGLAHHLKLDNINPDASVLAVAWILCKPTEPPRLAVSLYITPMVSRWLGAGFGGPRVVGLFFACLVLAEIGVFVAFAAAPKEAETAGAVEASKNLQEDA